MNFGDNEHETELADEDQIGDDDDDDDDDDDGGDGDPSTNRKRKRRVRVSRHIRLPERFDYTTSKCNSPPPDDGTGDRVVSLDDPTSTLSYHAELWKLFREIPSDDQIEQEAVAGCNLPNTKQIYDEITEVQGQSNYFQVDGHALSRCRMNDRHDLPPFMMLCNNSSSNNNNSPRTAFTMDDYGSTLRFEFFRQQMCRGSSPDSKRMVLEFMGTQTLLSVHRALVEFTDDELWEAAEQEATIAATNSTSTTTNSETTINHTDNERSGFFFIEGIFYTAGPVDYTTPILEWMNTGNQQEKNKRLRTHLGLTEFDTLPPVHSMAETRLQDIACRLGFRYVHVMHGDVECAVFCTDRRLVSRTAAASLNFPIIHDIWSPSPTLPECGACQRRPGSIATATTCEITGGHRVLCEDCCRQLQLPHKARDQIKRYSEWKSQADLSMGASTEKRF